MALISKPLTFATCKLLAIKRLNEAEILFSKRQYSGAYYLAGYCVEMALKACYCKNVRRYSFPPTKDIYSKLYDHDLNKLIDAVGIKIQFDTKSGGDPSFTGAWGVVKDWTSESRYQFFRKPEAEAMVSSVRPVLNWIQTLW